MTTLKIKPYTILENQKFLDKVIIEINKEDYEDVDFEDGKMTLFISNCDFKSIEIKNNESINFEDISICFNSCYIEHISITEIFSDKISLILGSSIVSGIIKNNNLKSITLNNCILNDSLFFINLNSISITYTEENIFIIRWRDFFKRIGISNIEEFLKKPQSYFIDSAKKINFYCHEVENEKRGIVRKKHELINDNKVLYYLTPCEKNKLNISLNLKYNIDLEDISTKVNNAYLYNLSISGKPNGKIEIEDSNIHRIYIHDFSPKNQFLLYNIKPLDTVLSLTRFEIHKSNLDNSWFDNVDFVKYSRVSFFRTRFNKTIFTSCNFPKDSLTFENFMSIRNIHYPDQKKESYYKDQYETFLQLKNSLESTGNIYESQKLQAISYSALRKIKDVTFWDKLILCLNEKSNNHSLSIIRPFVYFLILSIVFYILYLWSLGMMFNNHGINTKLFGYYFSFIDITHRTDFLVDKDEFNTLSLSLDFFSKLIFSFLIYQFIASFRKYGKK